MNIYREADIENLKGKYKIGFYPLIIEIYDEQTGAHLQKCSEICEKFIIGLPEDNIMARFFGDGRSGHREDTMALLRNLPGVTDIVIMDDETIFRQKMHSKIPYDVCFIGSEYGRLFEEDKKYFEEHNVDAVMIAPGAYSEPGEKDVIRVALDNVDHNQKVVLFGTGKYFDYFCDRYGGKYSVAYAVDNDSTKWGTSKRGIRIVRPDVLKEEDTDGLLVILCSRNYESIKDQLLKIKNFNYRTMLYNGNIALLDEYCMFKREEQDYLDRVHAALYKLLKEFDRVCRKHNLNYYIICGSLIGVLRHHDFIPWDDDVDIAMPRSDYNKLKKIAKTEWKNNKIFKLVGYGDLGGNAFLDFMPRFFLMNESFQMKVYDKVADKMTADIRDKAFLDIYVMDNACDNDAKHNRAMFMMKFIYNLCMGHRSYVEYEEYRRKLGNKIIIMKMVNKIGSVIPIRILNAMYEHYSQKYNKKETENYFMNSCAITCIERKFPKKLFMNGRDEIVGEMNAKVPKDAEGLMEAMGYHNYMTFPPCSIRKPSHYFNSDIEIW